MVFNGSDAAKHGPDTRAAKKFRAKKTLVAMLGLISFVALAIWNSPSPVFASGQTGTAPPGSHSCTENERISALAGSSGDLVQCSSVSVGGMRFVSAIGKSTSGGSGVTPFTSPNTCHYSSDYNNETCFQITGPNGTNYVTAFYERSYIINYPATIDMEITGPYGYADWWGYGWTTLQQGWYGIFNVYPDAYLPVGTYCGATWRRYLDGEVVLYSSACNTVHT